MVFQPRNATLESLVQSSSLEMAELQRNRPPEREPKPFTLAVRVCCVIHRYLYAYSAGLEQERNFWSAPNLVPALNFLQKFRYFDYLSCDVGHSSAFLISGLRASDYRYIFYLTAVDDVFVTDYKRLGSVDTWFLPVFSLPNSNFLLVTPRLEFFLYRY